MEGRALNWDDAIGGGVVTLDTESILPQAKAPEMDPAFTKLGLTDEAIQAEKKRMDEEAAAKKERDFLDKLDATPGLCRTVSMADIFDKQLPPPDQVLTDFADRGDKLFIIGTSKSRKSFTALQIALHIVSGGMARMPFGVPEVGRVER